ncbi:hypothetical protein LTR95_018720 [Oleoguttula sp. CCFEE 5521]
MSSLPPCFFLQLPPELRTTIYEYAFPTHQCYFIVSRSLWPDTCCDAPTALGLLATSHQIYSEALPIYLDRTTFPVRCRAHLCRTHGAKLGRPRDVAMLKHMKRVVGNMPATYNYFADDAASAAMRLMRASDYFKSVCYLTIRIANKHGETNNTRGRLLVFTAIRSPGLITLVIQNMAYSEEASIHVYKSLMGFRELTALLEE